jgi:hypothetical protein
VWYSSAWSHATLAAFRAALARVAAPSQGRHMAAAVAVILRHWQQHDVCLASSRQRWLASMTGTHAAEIGSFRMKGDRMAMCSYILTGQLLDADVGSVVMFALPRGAGDRADNELFLQVGGRAGCVAVCKRFPVRWLPLPALACTASYGGQCHTRSVAGFCLAQ